MNIAARLNMNVFIFTNNLGKFALFAEGFIFGDRQTDRQTDSEIFLPSKWAG